MNSYKIGLTTRILETKEYIEVRDSISHDLISFLDELKLLPVIIPNNLSLIKEYIESIDLLILSGGNDVSRAMDVRETGYSVSKFRDKVESKLISKCIEKKIPIIGICRGMQLINVFFGGNLRKVNQPSIHNSSKHEIVFIDKFTKGHELNKFEVNSFHNYTIDQLSSDLIQVAYSQPDKEIEALKHKYFPIYGIMWHPERNNPSTKATVFNNSLIHNILKNK